MKESKDRNVSLLDGDISEKADKAMIGYGISAGITVLVTICACGSICCGAGLMLFYLF